MPLAERCAPGLAVECRPRGLRALAHRDDDLLVGAVVAQPAGEEAGC